MTKEIKATKRIKGLNVTLILKVIKNRLYMQLKGIPAPFDVTVLQKLMEAKQAAAKKGIGQNETLHRMGKWVVLEMPYREDMPKPETPEQIEECEKEIIANQEQNFSSQGFIIQK